MWWPFEVCFNVPLRGVSPLPRTALPSWYARRTPHSVCAIGLLRSMFSDCDPCKLCRGCIRYDVSNAWLWVFLQSICFLSILYVLFLSTESHTHTHTHTHAIAIASAHFAFYKTLQPWQIVGQWQSSKVFSKRYDSSSSKFLPPMLSQSDEFYKIFQNNADWIKAKTDSDPLFFQRMAEYALICIVMMILKKRPPSFLICCSVLSTLRVCCFACRGQTPKFMIIGCADSRVDASQITGMPPGSLFMHRNIANLVVASDLNMLSVLQYAVEILKVRHIIVLGHYGCGGVQASMGNIDFGLVENWLRNIRDVQRLHDDELSGINDPAERFRRLVELNVQVNNQSICTRTIVLETPTPIITTVYFVCDVW
jgi:carbonic anhydrase